MEYLVSGASEGAVTFPTEDFGRSVRARWGGAVERVVEAGTGLVADIKEDDQPGFSIRLSQDGDAISTDGTRSQVADVALWSLGLLPEELSADVLLYDFNGQTVLRRGMTSHQVWSDWADV